MKRQVSILTLILLVTLSGVGLAQSDLKQISAPEIKNLKVDLGGGEIKFDSQLKGIKLSRELQVEHHGSNLRIFSPNHQGKFHWFGSSKDKDYQLIIGTRGRQLARIDIDVGGATLTGKLNAEQISIDGGGLDINAELVADQIDIDGGGLDINGRLTAEQLTVDGAGIDLNLEVQQLQVVELNGVGISADIKYLDAWTGVRRLKISGIGGSLDISLPRENKDKKAGRLDIEKDGMIAITVNQY